MPEYIFDCSGVNLRIEYHYDPDGVFAFEGCRVLDGTYAAVGPDLCSMFDDVLLMTNEMPPVAKPFLTVVVEEIENANATRS
jgi:hypothetical protein